MAAKEEPVLLRGVPVVMAEMILLLLRSYKRTLEPGLYQLSESYAFGHYDNALAKFSKAKSKCLLSASRIKVSATLANGNEV